MSTLHSSLTTLTSSTIDNNNLSYTMITGINSLPAELLLQILSLSFVSGSRKESYKILMLVCRRFVGPARQLLHRDIVTLTNQQSNSLLTTLNLYPNLCVVTRKFNLSYTINNFNGLIESVKGESGARNLLSLLWNVRDLVIQNDDGCKILRETITSTSYDRNHSRNFMELQEEINLTSPSTPTTTNFDQTPTTIPTTTTSSNTRTGLEELRSLTILNPSLIRWNDLITLVQDSPKLKSLSISGLCEPLPRYKLPPPPLPLSSPPLTPQVPSSSKLSSDTFSVEVYTNEPEVPRISIPKIRDLELEESKKEMIRIKKYYERLEKLLVPPPSSSNTNNHHNNNNHHHNNGIPFRRHVLAGAGGGAVLNDTHDDIGRWGLDMITIEDTEEEAVEQVEEEDGAEVLIIEDTDDEDDSLPSTSTTTTTTNSNATATASASTSIPTPRNITQALSTPEIPLILLPPNYLTFPHSTLTSLTLDQTTITDILLSSFLSTIHRSLSSFKLRNTKSITRLGLITILENGWLRGLIELEISNCDFDHDANDGLGGGAHIGMLTVGQLASLFALGPAVAAQQQNLPVPPPPRHPALPPVIPMNNQRFNRIHAPPPLPALQQQQLQQQFHQPNLNQIHLLPHHSLPINYSNPLDDLPIYCPFLQELIISSERLVSSLILNILIKNLPLCNLGLEFLRPKLGILELKEMFNEGDDGLGRGGGGGGGGRGRLEGLWIGKGMKWTKVVEAEARAICFKAGTMFTTSDDL